MCGGRRKVLVRGCGLKILKPTFVPSRSWSVGRVRSWEANTSPGSSHWGLLLLQPHYWGGDGARECPFQVNIVSKPKQNKKISKQEILWGALLMPWSRGPEEHNEDNWGTGTVLLQGKTAGAGHDKPWGELRGDLINVYKYLKGGARKTTPGSSWWCQATEP